MRCVPPLVSPCPLEPGSLFANGMPAGTASAGLRGLAMGEFGKGAGGEQGKEMGGEEAWRLLAMVAKEASGVSAQGQSPAEKGPPRRKTRLEKIIFRREMIGGLCCSANTAPIFSRESGLFGKDGPQNEA